MSLFNIKDIINTAKKEVAEEASKKAIEKLKELYKKRDMAQTALANIDREIADAEGRLAEGNL